MCKNSLLSSDSLPLQRLFISGLHSKGRHNMDKIFDMESMDYGMEKIRFFSNFGTFMYLSLRRPLSAKEKSMLFHP